MGFACLRKIWDLRGKTWALLAERGDCLFCWTGHLREDTKMGDQGMGCEELGLETEAELMGLAQLLQGSQEMFRAVVTAT